MTAWRCVWGTRIQNRQRHENIPPCEDAKRNCPRMHLGLLSTDLELECVISTLHTEQSTVLTLRFRNAGLGRRRQMELGVKDNRLKQLKLPKTKCLTATYFSLITTPAFCGRSSGAQTDIPFPVSHSCPPPQHSPTHSGPFLLQDSAQVTPLTRNGFSSCPWEAACPLLPHPALSLFLLHYCALF